MFLQAVRIPSQAVRIPSQGPLSSIIFARRIALRLRRYLRRHPNLGLEHSDQLLYAFQALNDKGHPNLAEMFGSMAGWYNTLTPANFNYALEQLAKRREAHKRRKAERAGGISKAQ